MNTGALPFFSKFGGIELIRFAVLSLTDLICSWYELVPGNEYGNFDAPGTMYGRLLFPGPKDFTLWRGKLLQVLSTGDFEQENSANFSRCTKNVADVGDLGLLCPKQ